MFQEAQLTGSLHKRPFAIDISHEPTGTPKPVVLFVHGFKGFKDWGTFPLIAADFVRRGYVFVKMNLSHNGVTIQDPVDFVDLDAFAANTFSTELQDIDDVINYIYSDDFPVPADECDRSGIILLGHSRGGSISYVKASTDQRIIAVSGWGAVCNLETRWPESMTIEWEEKGIYYLPNSRTGQMMPLNYTIVEDYREHREAYHIPLALSRLKIPALHVHGSNDETVYLQEARMVLKEIPSIDFQIIDGASHTFGGTHPFHDQELPPDTVDLLNRTDEFLRKALIKR